MTCKCGATTYEQHLAATGAGYPGHAFKGFVWSPASAEAPQTPFPPRAS